MSALLIGGGLLVASVVLTLLFRENKSEAYPRLGPCPHCDRTVWLDDSGDRWGKTYHKERR